MIHEIILLLILLSIDVVSAKIILFQILLSINVVSAYTPIPSLTGQKQSCWNSAKIPRRMILRNIATTVPLILQPTHVNAVDDGKINGNARLTDEEMVEYNRLLKEARRIQDVIDLNKERFLNEIDEKTQSLPRNSSLHWKTG